VGSQKVYDDEKVLKVGDDSGVQTVDNRVRDDDCTEKTARNDMSDFIRNEKSFFTKSARL